MEFWSKLLRRNKSKREMSAVLELGFHGDRYLLSLVDKMMPGIDVFFETGTNVGTTARFVAKTYPHVLVYSCEPDPDAFKVAQKTTADHNNVHLYNIQSPDFLYVVHEENPQLISSRNLYWLDAHDYGFKWPLHDEIAYITNHLERAIIIVDDAQVPDRPEFKYSAYDGQECNLDYISSALTPGKTYRICYPAYNERTSPHHPLTGYIVIVFGEQRLPDGLDNFIVNELKL